MVKIISVVQIFIFVDKGCFSWEPLKMLVCLIVFTSLDSVFQWVYGLLLGSVCG